MKTPGVARSRGDHEVSKPSVRVAKWRAERIGPMIIGAPHWGHAHEARVAVSVVDVAVASVEAGADGVASRGRASGPAGGGQGVGGKPKRKRGGGGKRVGL